MKHHFADLLEEFPQYWTLTPNRERWTCHFADLAAAPENTRKLTMTRDDKNWRRLRELPQLTELTLHEPGPDQLAALTHLHGLSALRISHARPKNLAMIEGLTALRELALEYVSGVDDLQPIGQLPALTALHLENLRRVADFSGLGLSRSLRYLAIYGTLDWNQPIESFEFLRGMENLECLRLGFGVRVPADPSMFDSLLQLKKLTRLEIGMGTLPLEGYAWLEAKLPHVEGTIRPAFVRTGGDARRLSADDYRARMPLDEFQDLAEQCKKTPHTAAQFFVGEDGKRYEQRPFGAMLLGKGQRDIHGTDARVTEKCAEYEKAYRVLVRRYQALPPSVSA